MITCVTAALFLLMALAQALPRIRDVPVRRYLMYKKTHTLRTLP